jgi:uncharacterized alpha-E superfamily protein
VLLFTEADASGEGQQWEPLVNTTGDYESFKKRQGEATQQNVIHFLTFDAENPNSILSCVRDHQIKFIQ